MNSLNVILEPTQCAQIKVKHSVTHSTMKTEINEPLAVYMTHSKMLKKAAKIAPNTANTALDLTKKADVSGAIFSTANFALTAENAKKTSSIFTSPIKDKQKKSNL